MFRKLVQIYDMFEFEPVHDFRANNVARGGTGNQINFDLCMQLCWLDCCLVGKTHMLSFMSKEKRLD
jgi:hypothetical protein